MPQAEVHIKLPAKQENVSSHSSVLSSVYPFLSDLVLNSQYTGFQSEKQPKDCRTPSVENRKDMSCPSARFYPSTSCSVSNRFSISIGFAICPFIPHFSASCLSSSKAFAVMANTGMDASPGSSSSRICLVAS